MEKAEIGSVSSGTMRPQDIIPVFLETLDSLSPGDCEKVLGNMSRGLPENDEDPFWNDDEMQFFISDIFDALNEHAPAFCYFGANEGDGACYGFWPMFDIMNEDQVLKVSDLSEIPEGYNDYVLLVNNHGNATLYRPVIDYVEEWAIV